MPPDLAQLLEERREGIVAWFAAQVQRKDLSPPGLSRSLLVDHIPGFLDEIVDELRHVKNVRFSHDAIDTSETARRHGEHRWRAGYDLEALIREYGILRHCVLQAAKDAGVELSIDEFDVLAKCLSVGVAEAATEYVKYRDEQLEQHTAGVEFLAEAGQLLTSSLDYRSTLNRLTRLLVPRLADWCAVHLQGMGPDEMAIAHVDPASVEVLREIYSRFPLPNDAAYGYPRVLRTGEPELVQVIDSTLFERAAQNDEHLNLMRRINTCSWMVVPLRVQGNMFGALTLGYSDSARHYDSADLTLACELAGRAAVAIDNARLYDLSQKERLRVEAATRAKDEFVAMVSHELRTPLNAILGWLRLMRGGTLSEEKTQHAFEVIERNALAQTQLVADLLDISSIITGKLRINPVQIDLANVVDMAIEGIRPAAEAKRIAIETQLERASALMRGDADRLQQVVWNLLANAVKFTPKNGHVAVRLRSVDSELELSVEDDGEGISESFLPHVFESFRQADSSATRPHGGLGIGLSIVKYIVELHGGVIQARSSGLGHGATFVVRLPVNPVAYTTFNVPKVAAARQQAPNTARPLRLDGVRALVVDDDGDARELLGYLLEAYGVEVRVTGSAAGALLELGKYTPHVIISDIGMPDEDGYTLIRKIRALAAQDKREIPAIALTGFARNEDRTRALMAGFNVYMVKPVEPALLANAVSELAGDGSLSRR